jgi:hypothetical protein
MRIAGYALALALATGAMCLPQMPRAHAEAAPGAGSTDLTPAEIQARAMGFLRTVKASDADAEPITIGTDPERSDATRFTFKSGSMISVKRSTGAVVSFIDFNGPLRQETGKRISEQEARELATRYLDIAGVTLEDAVYKNTRPAFIVNDGQPPVILMVAWDRVYRGYRVMHDIITVSVDGQTGAFVGVGDWFVSQMPTDLTPRLTLQQAEAIATAQPGAGTTWKGELAIYPLLKTVQGQDRCTTQTRVIWYMRPPNRGPGPHFYIDAITGDIFSRSAGRMGLAVPPAEAGKTNLPEADPYSVGIAVGALVLAALIGVCAVTVMRRVRVARGSIRNRGQRRE